MKKIRLLCLFTALTLSLCLPWMASAEPHLLLEDMNEGPCAALTGQVEAMVIFVNIDGLNWTEDALLSMQQELRSAADQLEREAAGYGAALSIRLNYCMGVTDCLPQLNNSSDWADELLLSIPALADRAESGSWQGVPLIFCCRAEGRAFAHNTVSTARPEYAILFADNDASTLRHELLHLYGAQDFYVEPAIKAAAQRIFPDSVMLSSTAESRVDGLTAYIVGWTGEPGSEAARFLQETASVTEEDFQAAREANQFTGVGVSENDDSVYSGAMVSGVYHGWGQLEWADGDVYAGEWMQGERTGKGVYRWASGSTYAGDFISGRRTGQGAYFWTDGNLYAGDFVDGARTGQGTTIVADGTIYSGSFADGTPHGQGTYTWPNGAIYSGSIVEGSRTGKGVCIWPDGSVYTGEFLNNQMHGFGTYLWADGASYTGEFSANQRHGSGVYRSADGAVLRGLWENGSYVSEASDTP